MSKKSVFPNIPEAIGELRDGLASLPNWGKLLFWVLVISFIMYLIDYPQYFMKWWNSAPWSQ